MSNKNSSILNNVKKTISNITKEKSNNNPKTLTEQMKNIRNRGMNVIKDVKNTASNAGEKIKKAANNIKDDFKEASTNKGTTTGKITEGVSYLKNLASDLSNTNTTFSKIIFLVALLFIFVLLFNLGIRLFNYFLTPNKNPVLLKGMVDSRKEYIISSNPNVPDSKPIIRSVNKEQGIEFTWNVWIFIDDYYNNSSQEYRTIFRKGKKYNYNESKDASINDVLLNSGPGLYLNSSATSSGIQGNALSLVFGTYNSYDSNNMIPYEIIEIDNIPIKKWICCTIRVQNKTVDVYINGVLTKRTTLQNVPIQNYYDTYVGNRENGMGGYVSSLRYFGYAIGYDKIQELLAIGPNLKLLGEDMKNNPPYLSMKWYYNDIQ